MPIIQPSFLFLLDRDDGLDQTRATTGIYAKGSIGVLKYEAEGYLQFGERGDADIFAFLAAGRVGYGIPAPSVNPWIWVWAELVSGDQNTAVGDINAFDTLFATNHKFYGFMDFFLGIPGGATGTSGHGLVDLGGRFKIAPMKGISAMLDYHFFMTHKDVDDADGGDTRMLGSEIDLTVKAKVNKFLTLVGGGGVMIPSEGLGCLRQLDADGALVTCTNGRPRDRLLWLPDGGCEILGTTSLWLCEARYPCG